MRVASFASFAASATTTTKPSTATRIHIGSCSDTEEFQPMWSTLRRRRGDAFFWGGDIVYGDRFSPEALYGKQKRESGYAAYAASLAVVDGIWDDHDRPSWTRSAAPPRGAGISTSSTCTPYQSSPLFLAACAMLAVERVVYTVVWCYPKAWLRFTRGVLRDTYFYGAGDNAA
ncbi:PhoD-like phosphatase [Aureococcus anophagefferens]|nr:PhoD-like phosphatase [Aureococcus anophagefferens]